MDVRRSRLLKNPVNIGRSAQKSAKQGDGPSARGTQSTKEGNSHRDTVKTCPQEWLLKITVSRGGYAPLGTQFTKEGNSHRDKAGACPQVWLRFHKPQTDRVTPSCFIQPRFFKAQISNSILKLNSLSGLRPRPHARRGFSLRSSLLGASGFIQPTAVIMRHAKQSAPERPL